MKLETKKKTETGANAKTISEAKKTLAKILESRIHIKSEEYGKFAKNIEKAACAWGENTYIEIPSLKFSAHSPTANTLNGTMLAHGYYYKPVESSFPITSMELLKASLIVLESNILNGNKELMIESLNAFEKEFIAHIQTCGSGSGSGWWITAFGTVKNFIKVLRIPPCAP